MIIELIDDERRLTDEQAGLMHQVVSYTAKKLGLSDAVEVDISIVDNDSIHALNKQYRGIDRPTDVLSFALEEDVADAPEFNFASFAELEDESDQDLAKHLGDIIISYDRAQEQAVDYGHSLERELAFLAVHGFLHLNGYDHQTPEDEAEMFGLQEEVLEANGYAR